jgi:T-complex protein 1 subunit gamma
MILDSMGHIQLTSDGNTILREVDVSHPAAKNMIQLSRTQDEEVGDGTTSVIILAGEILNVSEPFILQNLHPTKIVKSYFKCLEDAVEMSETFAKKIDLDDDKTMKNVIGSCLGTKFTKNESEKLSQMALDAVKTIRKENDVDIKRYIRVEKISGGSFEDSKVIQGVILNKDVLHSAMKRKLVNPKILLLDVSIEFQKGESMTNVEIEDSKHFSKLLSQEDDYVKKVCDEIIKFKPDLVITEKGKKKKF